jgi:hypothetical protein
MNVVVDGSAVPGNYQLNAVISSLEDTSTDALTLTGTHFDQLVGAIS